MSFVLVLFLWIVPASSYGASGSVSPVQVKQADGSSLTIKVIGDEFFHYTTTVDDYPILQKEDGLYYYVDYSADGRATVTDIRASDPGRRSASERRAVALREKGVRASMARSRAAVRRSALRRGLDTGFPTTGSIRSLVILVNFSDVRFTVSDPRNAFSDMLNREGYSANGAVGSARDYYVDNSGGKFVPQFDVFGPVTLDHPMAYYGANDEFRDPNAERMIVDACRKAHDAGVNFADYDLDGDGMVDNVFVYYAGYNESEGGGSNTIWPHRDEITDWNLVLDGKQMSVYACSSELSGQPDYNSRMAGIGTFCHEFGHVLGWPDFYDTDGDENGTGIGVFNWSLMCRGSLNDGGRIPPALTTMEKMMVGWMEPVTINRSGDYRLESVDKDQAYLLRTDTEGEYFLLENRQKTGWDRALKGHGLLIFHVDRSDRLVEGHSALDRWVYNTPNSVADHPCFRLVTARPNSGEGYEAYMPYPGESDNKEFSGSSKPSSRTWSGADLGASVTNIAERDGVIYFTVRMTDENPDGDGKFSVDVQPFQTSAFVTWEGSGAAQWKVQWRTAAEEDYARSELLDEPKIDIASLEPGTEYVLQITERKSNLDGAFRIARFKTASLGEFAGMALRSSYKKGETVLLRAVNLKSDSQASWKVDGQAVTETELQLGIGEHEIELTVGSGSDAEIITKFIQVTQ